MIIATTTWPGPSVVQPMIERRTAMRLAQTDGVPARHHAVDALQPEDWTRPTDCAAWTYASWLPTSPARRISSRPPWSWCAKCAEPRPGKGAARRASTR